jgi:hypothetical protein
MRMRSSSFRSPHPKAGEASLNECEQMLSRVCPRRIAGCGARSVHSQNTEVSGASRLTPLIFTPTARIRVWYGDVDADQIFRAIEAPQGAAGCQPGRCR